MPDFMYEGTLVMARFFLLLFLILKGTRGEEASWYGKRRKCAGFCFHLEAFGVNLLSVRGSYVIGVFYTHTHARTHACVDLLSVRG